MFLTRITLTRKNFRDLKITDEYSFHRVVYSLFQDGERERFLYVDKGPRDGFHTLLVLSSKEPAASEVHMEVKPISKSFLMSDRYAFEVVLNPVKRGHQSRKLEPILGQLPLLRWFMEKAAANGFSPDEERLVVKVQSSQTFNGKHERQVVHHRVLFTGVLTVTDRELFIQAFQNGIGRGKAFGFGLLQLIPLHD